VPIRDPATPRSFRLGAVRAHFSDTLLGSGHLVKLSVFCPCSLVQGFTQGTARAEQTLQKRADVDT
jgi:hypothetical protein